MPTKKFVDETPAEPLVDDAPVEDTPETAPEKPAPAPDAAPVDYSRYQAFLAWERSQASQAAALPERPEEWYVWLANGDVHRVKEADFPVSLTVDKLGHYEIDGNSHTVIGVYPVEIKLG